MILWDAVTSAIGWLWIHPAELFAAVVISAALAIGFFSIE